MYAKRNGRVSFRSNKRPHYKKNTNSYLNNKSRPKGNITQLYEKYSKLAKEASSSGDRIQSEYYYQFADHYSRLMIEFGLKSFNNTDSSESVDEKILQNEEQNEELSQLPLRRQTHKEWDESLKCPSECCITYQSDKKGDRVAKTRCNYSFSDNSLKRWAMR